MTITAVTLNGADSNLSDAAIDAFRSSIRGELILGGSTNYETARQVWNGNIDRRPALIGRLHRSRRCSARRRLRAHARAAALLARRRA